MGRVRDPAEEGERGGDRKALMSIALHKVKQNGRKEGGGRVMRHQMRSEISFLETHNRITRKRRMHYFGEVSRATAAAISD